jgi:outer membrane immunogenic protein
MPADDCGRSRERDAVASGAADVVRTRLQVEQALVGVNYKFNLGGPALAKY